MAVPFVVIVQALWTMPNFGARYVGCMEAAVVCQVWPAGTTDFSHMPGNRGRYDSRCRLHCAARQSKVIFHDAVHREESEQHGSLDKRDIRSRTPHLLWSNGSARDFVGSRSA